MASKHLHETIDISAYRLPDRSDEKRCTLKDARDILTKLHGYAPYVPVLDPVGAFVAPQGASNQIGIVTVDTLIAAGADINDDGYPIMLRLKALDQGHDESRADPNFELGHQGVSCAEAVEVFKSGDVFKLRGWFAGLRGHPGQNAPGFENAGATDYEQFMNQPTIKDAAVANMQAGLDPAEPTKLPPPQNVGPVPHIERNKEQQ